jgi:hypothetical protein
MRVDLQVVVHGVGSGRVHTKEVFLLSIGTVQAPLHVLLGNAQRPNHRFLKKAGARFNNGLLKLDAKLNGSIDPISSYLQGAPPPLKMYAIKYTASEMLTLPEQLASPIRIFDGA